MLASTVLREL
jgi:hypothetical protein